MGDLVVGIDIGTSKVCTLIGQVGKDNQIEVLGKGIEPCNGIKKGVIVDIDSTSSAIRRSVEKAETMANVKVGSAFVNIIGAHVTIINNRNIVNISNESHEITAKDVEKAIYSNSNVKIDEDKQIIDIIPQQYIIDGYDEIIDPVGMVGLKLEADVDIVAGKITSVQNIVKSVERANIKVNGLIVEALSSGEILLTPDEKEIGAVLIDIGGGVTDVSVFKNKKLVFYDTIPVGGDHITNDISIGLKIPYQEAEKIKRKYELALTSLIKNDQDISVTDINENRKKDVRISEVVDIIEARVYEIFCLCRELVEKANSGFSYDAGVVLTGSGISYVDGAMQLAYEVFNLPVRIASYKLSDISKIEYATAAGIIKYIAQQQKGRSSGCEVTVRKTGNVKQSKGLWQSIMKFFSRFFCF